MTLSGSHALSSTGAFPSSAKGGGYGFVQTAEEEKQTRTSSPQTLFVDQGICVNKRINRSSATGRCDTAGRLSCTLEHRIVFLLYRAPETVL